MAWIWLIAALLLVLALLPVALELRRKMPDRTAAPGAFAHLASGVTHYQWIGPVRGPVAVAVHGQTTPSPAWYSVAEDLGRLGYRVLVYDLYGRGYSDNPKGRQDEAHFVIQLTELLADQGIGEDITLLGYSMGGGIVTRFAAQNPHRIKRLILFASAGVDVTEGRLGRFMREVPLLGDWLFHMAAHGQFRRQLRASQNSPAEVPEIAGIQLAQLDRRGFWPAVLSSARHGLDRMEAEHRKLASDGVPVVALWGELDDVIPISSVGRLAQWNRNARQEVIAGAGHGLPYTHGRACIALLGGILRE